MEAISTKELETRGVIRRRGKNLELVGTKLTTEEVPAQETINQDSLPTKSREESLAEKEAELAQMAMLVRTGLGVLGQRVLTFFALLAGIAAFGNAVYEPTTLRITAAVLYAALVLLPLAWIDARR